MNTQELIAAVAASTGRKQVEVKEVLLSLQATIIEKTAAGEEVKISGLGIFKRQERKETMGRNPRTGESKVVPAKKVAKFQPAKEFRDRVAG